MQKQQHRHGTPQLRYGTNTNGPAEILNYNYPTRHVTIRRPDGGGGGGGGYGGTGGGSGVGGGAIGVRAVGAAPSSQQQDKTPPPSLAIHHANHMMSTFHTARPPAQPPPSGATIHPSYLPYANIAAPRQQPRHPITTRPATIIPFVQYPDASINPLAPQYYSPSALSLPLMFQANTPGSDTGGRPPPHFQWPANPQPPITVMTAQPPTAQPNPQQQPQPQPSPYSQNQFAAYVQQPRVHQGYNTAGGPAATAAAAGIQQAPPSVIVDNRQLQPPQAQLQAKNKQTRANRIPIIDPNTMKEINLEVEVSGNFGPGGNVDMHPDHAGSGHHPTLGHHGPSYQVSSSTTGNALIAADFAKQVLVAMDDDSNNTRPPREEEPQVNGPAGVALGASPVIVEESSGPINKRPPVPTPVVSAQAEGTTYDIQTIRSSTNKNIELRSGESSPARSFKAPQVNVGGPQSSAPPPQHSEPPAAPVVITTEQQVEPPKQQRRPRGPLPTEDKKQPQQQQPQVISSPQKPPVQMGNPTPRMPIVGPDFTKKVVLGLNNDSNTRPQREDEPQMGNPAPRMPIVGPDFTKKVVLGLNNDSNTRPQREEEPQVEEKNEESRSRVSSLSTVKTTPIVKEEEPVPVVKQPPVVVTTQIVTPQVKQPATISKPVQQQQATIPQQIQPPIQQQQQTQSPPTPVIETKLYQPTIEKQPPPPIVTSTTPVIASVLEKSKPAVEKKPADTRSSVEKTVEKAVPEPVIEKQVIPEPVSEPPRVTKVIEKRPISPAVTSVPAPAAKTRTTFAEGFSLEAMKMTAKAAESAVAAAQTATQTTASQQQQQQSEQQINATETTHAPTKPVSRAKQKGKQKLREMNQKGAEKEGGTDMDAFVDTRTVSTPQTTAVSDNNNRTSSNDTLATKNSDISNRTAPTLDNSTKENRNLDNVLRPSDGTTRPDSNNKTLRDKSPAVTTEDATNNNVNNQIAQQYDDGDADDIVAAKNEENMKKSNLADANNTDSSQVIAPPPLSQPSLKYQYKDDQWSPMNPQGKKVYDRDFLIKLREDPLSSKKPDITSDLEIFVKDRDNVGGRDSGSMRRGLGSHNHYVGSNFGSLGGMRGSNNALFPDFSRSLSHRLPAKRNSQGSGSNRGPGGSGGARSLKNVYNSFSSMRDEFKLTLNENAWKPSKLAKLKDNESKDEKEAADLYKRVRGILNKLTPQKFETLLSQFQNLPINSLERLQGTIGLVFEKAVDEPAFSVSYANLCKMLSRLQVVENSQQQQNVQSSNPDQQSKPPINFRKLLITKCQQEFETNKKLELDFEQKQKDINECPDLEKRKEMQLVFNDEERKIRMKSVGLVTFIGELFKLKMLTVNIMHGCMKQLLEKIDEESLECLCKLLTTIGRDFEEQITNSGGGSNKQNSSTASSLHEFNEYFTQMTRLSRKHEGSKVSSRVRFMLQDVIELRSNHWVPRRDENKPKTMAQIQEDVERESERKAALLASQPSRSMSQNMSQDRGQRRNNPRGGNIQSEDGWTNVSGRFTKTGYSTGVTVQGLRSIAGQELEGRGMKGEMTLAPPNSAQRWCAGASSNRVAPGSGAAFTDKNSFSILDEQQKQNQGVPGRVGSLKSHADDRTKDNKEVLQSIHAYYHGSSNSGDSNRDSSSEKDSRFHGGPTGGSPSPSLSGPPMKKPIQDPIKKPMEVSRGDKKPTPSSSPAPIDRQSSREPLPSSEPIKEIDIEKLPQCVKTIIEEYISNRNIQESLESYKDRFTNHGPVFIYNCLNYIVEQTKEDKRTHASQLLGELLRHQLFPASQLVTEMENFFEIIFELEVDIPFIWQYIGQIFGIIMCLEVLDFSHVKDASKAISSNEFYISKLNLTLKAIFKILMLEKGPVWIKKCWDSSNVQVKDFANDEEACVQFLSEFSFLEGKEVPLSDSKIPYDKVQEKLLSFLKGGTDNFDQIFGWLSTNVGQRTNEPMFIRQLTEVVIKASLVSDDDRKMQKLDKGLFQKNMILIKRYVDNKEELELWCLYSVQHLVVATLESPSGMLVDIFQELYESQVISPDGFYKWRQEDAMSQSWQKEGRGVAVAVLNTFFTQVNQNFSNDEHDEDDDLPS